MTYEIREYLVDEMEDEEILSHVWFQVKDIDEAMKAIFKRVFGDNEPVHSKNEWTGHNCWTLGDYSLWETYSIFGMKFDLDNNVGPETIKRYVIEEAA